MTRALIAGVSAATKRINVEAAIGPPGVPRLCGAAHIGGVAACTETGRLQAMTTVGS